LLIKIAFKSELENFKYCSYLRSSQGSNLSASCGVTEMTVRVRTSPPDLIRSTTCLWVAPSTLTLFLQIETSLLIYYLSYDMSLATDTHIIHAIYNFNRPQLWLRRTGGIPPFAIFDPLALQRSHVTRQHISRRVNSYWCDNVLITSWTARNVHRTIVRDSQVNDDLRGDSHDSHNAHSVLRWASTTKGARRAFDEVAIRPIWLAHVVNDFRLPVPASRKGIGYTGNRPFYHEFRIPIGERTVTIGLHKEARLSLEVDECYHHGFPRLRAKEGASRILYTSLSRVPGGTLL